MKFQGVFTPTITPLDENEHVDEASFITHIDRLIDFGIHGLFLLGSSGESVALTADQRRKAMEIAVDAVDAVAREEPVRRVPGRRRQEL